MNLENAFKYLATISPLGGGGVVSSFGRYVSYQEASLRLQNLAYIYYMLRCLQLLVAGTHRVIDRRRHDINEVIIKDKKNRIMDRLSHSQLLRSSKYINLEY
jgi:hypothetical protein